MGSREVQVDKRVLKALNRIGMAEKRHGSVFGHNGRSDVIACVRGRCIVVENKRPGVRKVTKLQEVYLERMARHGALAFVCNCAEDVEAMLAIIEETRADEYRAVAYEPVEALRAQRAQNPSGGD